MSTKHYLYELKIYYGPVWIEEFAAKVRACGFSVDVGTEHIYVFSIGEDASQALIHVQDSVRDKYGSVLGITSYATSNRSVYYMYED